MQINLKKSKIYICKINILIEKKADISIFLYFIWFPTFLIF